MIIQIDTDKVAASIGRNAEVFILRAIQALWLFIIVSVFPALLPFLAAWLVLLFIAWLRQ